MEAPTNSRHQLSHVTEAILDLSALLTLQMTDYNLRNDFGTSRLESAEELPGQSTES